MQQQVLVVHDVDELKQRLIDVWHHRWLNWSVAQMSLCMNLCEMKTFWAFSLTPLTHMLFFVSCLLILWTLASVIVLTAAEFRKFRFLIFRKVVQRHI